VKDNRMLMTPQFDACASWWTQGPDSKLQVILLALSVFSESLLLGFLREL
jgi:hypothetical protein